MLINVIIVSGVFKILWTGPSGELWGRVLKARVSYKATGCGSGVSNPHKNVWNKRVASTCYIGIFAFKITIFLFKCRNFSIACCWIDCYKHSGFQPPAGEPRWKKNFSSTFGAYALGIWLRHWLLVCFSLSLDYSRIMSQAEFYLNYLLFIE